MASCMKSLGEVRSQMRYHFVYGTAPPVLKAGIVVVSATSDAGDGFGASTKSAKSMERWSVFRIAIAIEGQLRRVRLTIVWVSSSRGLRAEHVLEHARHGCNGDTMVGGRERRWKEMKCGAKAGLAVSGPTNLRGAVLGGAYEPTNLRAIRPSQC